MLYDFAVKSGAKVRFRSTVASVADSTNQPTIMLSDGTELKCDLIVGADGKFLISQPPSLFQILKPVFTFDRYSVCCLACFVSGYIAAAHPVYSNARECSQSVMEQKPANSELYHKPPSMHQFMAPGRFIAS